MAGFSASSFKSKLEKLSESQQSIQTLSHWVQYHKKSVKESAAIWAHTESQAMRQQASSRSQTSSQQSPSPKQALSQ